MSPIKLPGHSRNEKGLGRRQSPGSRTARLAPDVKKMLCCEDSSLKRP